MNEDVRLFLDYVSEKLVLILPRLAMAVLILLIGYMIGKLLKKLILRFILFLNIKMNQGLQNSMLNVDLKSSATFVSTAFFWVIIIFTLLICVQVLKLDFLSAWMDRVLIYLPNVLAAIIIVLVGIISGRLLSELIQSAASKTGLANGKLLGKIVRYLILFIAIVIALDQVGVDIAFLSNLFIVILASLMFGAALAFALGARTSISNILGSHYARKTHQLGTKIRIGEVEGTIVKITDHAISIETTSGLMVIPAKDFNESNVLIIKDHQNEK